MFLVKFILLIKSVKIIIIGFILFSIFDNLLRFSEIVNNVIIVIFILFINGFNL